MTKEVYRQAAEITRRQPSSFLQYVADASATFNELAAASFDVDPVAMIDRLQWQVDRNLKMNDGPAKDEYRAALRSMMRDFARGARRGEHFEASA